MKVRIDESLGYWFFYTHRSVANAFAEVLKQCCLEQKKPYVVTPPQWGVLALLYEEGGMTTIGRISEKRRVDAPTMTGIVKRLEQSGLLERLHDQADRRVVKVCLTEEGRECFAFLADAVDTFDELTRRGLSEAEQRDLFVKMQRVIANVSMVAPETNPGTNPGINIIDRFRAQDLSCEALQEPQE